MAIIECENGHLYDNAQNESCPYCRGGIFRVDFGPDDNEIGRTVLLDSEPGTDNVPEAGDIGKTVLLEAPPAFGEQPAAEIQKPVQNASGDISISGWLVCTSGPDKGRDITVRGREELVLSGGTYVFVPFDAER